MQDYKLKSFLSFKGEVGDRFYMLFLLTAPLVAQAYGVFYDYVISDFLYYEPTSIGQASMAINEFIMFMQMFLSTLGQLVLMILLFPLVVKRLRYLEMRWQWVLLLLPRFLMFLTMLYLSAVTNPIGFIEDVMFVLGGYKFVEVITLAFIISLAFLGKQTKAKS